MDDRDKIYACAENSLQVSDAKQGSLHLAQSHINHNKHSSASTHCRVSVHIPTHSCEGNILPQNIKVEDKLQGCTADDDIDSRQKHGDDSDATTCLERMLCEAQQEFNERERIPQFRNTCELPSDDVNDVTVKQEMEVDADEYDRDSEDARRWFVCEEGELREVTDGLTESVSTTPEGEGGSTNDTKARTTQQRTVSSSSCGTSCTKSRRLRIYDRCQPGSVAHRDLSIDDFSVTVQRTRQKKYAKRNELTLQYKLDLIKAAAESGKSCRQLANDFHIGRTQASSILKRKTELLRECEQSSLHRKRGLQKTANKDVNVICWEWFQTARSLNIPITGAMVQEKALKCARHLGNTDFKASNGWLESFRKRHGISFSVKCGAPADVSPDAIDDWQQRIVSITDSYKQEDAPQSDGAELFDHASRDKTLGVESQVCKDTRRLTKHLPVDPEANGVGDREERCLIASDEDALKWVGGLADYGLQKNDTVLLNMVAAIKAHLQEKIARRQGLVDC